MININKYNTLTDYLESDNIVSDECRVSQIGPSENTDVLFSPPTAVTSNRAMSANQLQKDEVAIVVKDRLHNKIKYIPQQWFDLSTLDQSLYEVKPWIRYRGEGKLQLMVYKNDTDLHKWARNNYYKVTVDTTTGGTITIDATISNIETTATYSYSAGSTLDSIVTGLNQSFSDNKMVTVDGAVGLYIGHLEGENFIRISIGTSSKPNLSITGGQLVDLSQSAQYRGLALTSENHDWSAEFLTSLFSSDSTLLLDLRTAYSSSTNGGIANLECYNLETPVTSSSGGVYTVTGTNHTNLAQRCGANLARYKSRFINNSGSTTYNHIYSSLGPVNKATLDAMNPGSGPDDTSYKAIYRWLADKTGITDLSNLTDSQKDAIYTTYLKTRMVDPDYDGGICKLSKNNGQEVSDILSNVTTLDFEGNWVSAFPAAYAAHRITDPDLCPNGAGLPTAHQLALFMCDDNPDRFTYINSAISKLGGTELTNSGANSYNSITESQDYTVWRYHGTYGTIRFYSKNSSLCIRPTIVYSA